MESGRYPREISKLGTRVIPKWHIAPPVEVDRKIAIGTDTPPEAIQRTLAPILKVTTQEKEAWISDGS